MAYEVHRPGHQSPIKAASSILPRSPVTLVGTSELLVIPVGSLGQEPFGMTGAPSAGASGIASADIVTVYEELNIVKARAAASLGAGAVVGIASTNGALGPVAVASGTLKWAVGKAMSPAAAGEIFSLYVKPRELGGQA